MMTAPAGLLIKTLLVACHTIPTGVVQTIVLTHRFDYVRGFAITAFAAINFLVFSRNHDRFKFYHVVLECADLSAL